MDEPRPCPFCGSEPHFITRKGNDGWRDYYFVVCDFMDGGCGASGGWYHDALEAIEAWNRRVNDE